MTWRAASGGDACESFIYEIAPESGGEATAEDAIAAWAEGDRAREYGEVESTGWVLTSEGNGIQALQPRGFRALRQRHRRGRHHRVVRQPGHDLRVGAATVVPCRALS
ncbi:hypothetical protein [Demequina litorisediminis]|uniref:hypothetical protein n=1 Tax=Demequina litorisediminis TaxID=1849022 RepID=UPI0024E0EB02|nr:hypothetical protein [Demequina litorisediminis]